MDILILIVLVIGGSFATFLLAIWLTSILKKFVSKDGRGSSGGSSSGGGCGSSCGGGGGGCGGGCGG